MNERKTEKTLYFNKHINCTHNIVVVTLVVLCFDQGWQPAFTAGIIHRLKPDKAGPDNTPKSGFYYFSSLFLH